MMVYPGHVKTEDIINAIIENVNVAVMSERGGIKMPTVRNGHNFHCGNCKRKIEEGEDYYTNDGDIFGYCFSCWVHPIIDEE